MPARPYEAVVVSHTHWDREWYRTFEVFRHRLVALLDALLDLFDHDPRYGPFYLDGQMRPVEDYLEIRPDQRARLEAAFESGRLYAGPWYVQPDEFLVSGEAIIRNLLMGRDACRQWKTGAPIGYAPDAFGHIAQMPQILRGFGIDNAVLFRGITADQVAAEFAWRSPDGSEVLCAKMPDDNAYSNWFYRLRETLADTDRGVPMDRDRVVQEILGLLNDSLRERPTTDALLWMDGVDHIFPQPRTPDIIEIVNEALADRVTAKSGTLMDYLEAVQRQSPELDVVTGELRVSNRAWKLQALLTHVASSRINLKQRNHACETLLERWAEPWTAFAWAWTGDEGATTSLDPDPQPFIRHAWKTLLLNHPHDSICGCSIDQVHRDMLPRFEQVEQIGEMVTRTTLDRIAGLVDTSFTREDRHDPDVIGALVVFNPLGWSRQCDRVTADLFVPTTVACDTIGIVRNGAEIEAEVEPLPSCHTLTQAPHDIPVGHAWRRFRVAFRADAPGFGVSVYHIIAKTSAIRARPSDTVLTGEDWIENRWIRLAVHDNGALSLEDRRTGQTYEGLMAFEDGGDVGDGYNYIAPRADTVLRSDALPPTGSDATARVERRGEDAAIIVTHTWYLPQGREGDARDGATQAPVRIVCEAVVSPSSPRVDLTIQVDNTARDHRLRVLFPSGASDARSYTVEQAFGCVERPIRLPDCTGWKEPQPGTGPQKTWVDVSDGSRALAVINRGLPECEVLDDAARTIAVTLLRCTGQGVGLPEDQRDSQMIGTHVFELALFPHGGDWRDAGVWREAHAFNVPMRAVQTDMHDGPVADGHAFLSVGPASLVPSAVKRSDGGNSLVVRAYSLADVPVTAEIDVGWPGVWRRHRLRLDESATDESSLVLPFEIATFGLERPMP